MKRTIIAVVMTVAMAGVGQPFSRSGHAAGGEQTGSGCRVETLGTVSGQGSSSTPVPAGWRRAGGGPVTATGRLGTDCVSPNWNGELGRYYSFALSQPAEVEITVTSSEVNPWVGLREGANIRGMLMDQASAWAGDVASLTGQLNAGTYAIEVSSAEEGVATTGPFTLTVAARRSTADTPVAERPNRGGRSGEDRAGTTRRQDTSTLTVGAQRNRAGRPVATPPNRGGRSGANRAGTTRRQATSPRVGEVFTDCDDCPRMVAVAGGTFRMGTTEKSDEQPVHNVRIRRFAIGVEEVTTDDIEAWYQDTRGRGAPPCNNQERRGAAAACVSWYDAKAYVAWLSRKTGQRYRLLTEAEWEYVAQRPYDFGVYDMVGNVFEWVEDCWHDSYRGAPTDGSAWTGGADCRRVVRGGSWGDADAEYRRPGARNRHLAGNRHAYDGFRVARTLD